ncbi:MAG: cytochrome c oxidase subunit II [Dehalococcoidia bacterium]
MPMARLERVFIWTSISVLVVGLIAIAASWLVGGIELPGPAGRVDPAALASDATFSEPGLRQIGENEYEAVLIAQTWSFAGANELTVPAGSTVHFKVTSADVIHGFYIRDVLVNSMVIPGQVTEVTAHFDEAGEYQILCHEYCGIGHHLMAAMVTVE